MVFINKNLIQLTTEQLLDLFSERGIKCCQKNKKNIILLNNIGYYELKRYSYKYYDGNKYVGLSFNSLLQRYYFDKKLRNSILDAIEDIELALNSHLSKVLGTATIDTDSSLGYSDFNKWCQTNGYNNYLKKDINDAFIKKEQNKFLNSLKDKTKKSSLKDIKTYFKNNNGSYPPVWMMVNVLNLGDSIHIFRLMDMKYKIQVADEFNINVKKLDSWLKCINLIRNICCHNEDLIDFSLKQRPKEPTFYVNNLFRYEFKNKKNNNKSILTNKIAIILCIIFELTKTVNPYYNFEDINESLKNFIKNDRDAKVYGFKNINCFNNLFK